MNDQNLPIVVDLDGTLIYDEISFISLKLFLRQFWKAPLLLWWMLRGVAYAKQQLARRIKMDVSTLHYNQRVISYLKDHQGRTIILATGADEVYANQVAKHLGLFTHVIASNGIVNSISTIKAQRLDEFLQGLPYIYIGNSSQDLNVWKHAAYAIAVNTPDDVVQQLKGLGVPYEVWG